ncbi:MAG: cell wall hydrolase [Geminicoccaceae bacterium]
MRADVVINRIVLLAFPLAFAVGVLAAAVTGDGEPVPNQRFAGAPAVPSGATGAVQQAVRADADAGAAERAATLAGSPAGAAAAGQAEPPAGAGRSASDMSAEPRSPAAVQLARLSENDGLGTFFSPKSPKEPSPANLDDNAAAASDGVLYGPDGPIMPRVRPYAHLPIVQLKPPMPLAYLPPPPPASMLHNVYQPAARMTDPVACLTLAMYWEARGEGIAGMRAVGNVVMNRVKSRRFPGSVCAVVRDSSSNPRCQFSWWCDGLSDIPGDRRSFVRAWELAVAILNGEERDTTGGALYFHATYLGTPWTNDWGRRLRRTASVGGHVFYR